MPRLDTLLQFLAQLPRHRLGTFPTPLVRLDRLSEQLDLDLWMKRDDCSGLALGGNKARKLEFVLADARAKGATTLVTVGPLTSNHTMMTATAARRAGFAMHCVVAGAPPDTADHWRGNLLLLDYLGVDLHFVDVDMTHPQPGDPERVDARCREVTAQTAGYFIPAGGTMPQAEPGYMSCVAEIARQRGGDVRLRSRRARLRHGVDDDRRAARPGGRRDRGAGVAGGDCRAPDGGGDLQGADANAAGAWNRAPTSASA